MRRRISWIEGMWILLIVVALAVAIVTDVRRHRVEVRNRTVELTMDYRDAMAISEAAGYPFEDFVRRAKEAGITSFGLLEETVGDMVAGGRVGAFSGGNLLAVSRFNLLDNDPALCALRQAIAPDPGGPGDTEASGTGYTYLLPRDRRVYEYLKERLNMRLGPGKVHAFELGDGGLLKVNGRTEDVLLLNLGISGLDLSRLQRNGLGIVPRFRNFPRLASSQIRQAFEGLGEAARGSIVVFDGEEVLGYRDELKSLAEVLKEKGILFGYVEFAEQAGEEELARLTDLRMVRVHSITSEEMPEITVSKATDRLLRAVYERNVRVLYLRPFQTLSGFQDPIEGNLDHIKSLVSRLRAAGFEAGRAHAYEKFSTGLLPLAVMGLGILGAGLLLLGMVAGVTPKQQGLLFGAGALIYLGLLLGGYELFARKLIAFGAGVIFPSLAVFFVVDQVHKPLPGGSGFAAFVRKAFASWAGAFLISIAGGLLIAGVLGDIRFMVKIEQFLGVKAMHVLPLGFAALLYWQYWRLPEEDRRDLFKGIRAFLAEPLRMEHVVALGILAVVGLVYVVRTGNMYGIPVPGLEEKMRIFLEKTLHVRPRTKEWLIGHPAMILAAIAMLRRDRRLVLPLLLAGTVGLISIANTFAHIHTPIATSLERTLLGILVGGMLGMVVALAYLGLARRARKVEGRMVRWRDS